MVRKLLAGLTPREAFILRSRHGFDGKKHTLEELRRELGLTRERVRQIEASALASTRQMAGTPPNEPTAQQTDRIGMGK